MNDLIIELCQLNGVSLYCMADKNGVKWQAVQTEWHEGRLMVRHVARIGTPEEAIAACKCADWEESKPWTPAI